MRKRSRGLAAALVVATSLSAGVVAGGATAQGDPAPALIAFSNGGRIFTIEADGANRQRLTGGARPRLEVADYSPAWSPDGARFAFLRVIELANEDYRPQIHLMQADGTGRERLPGSGRRVYPIDVEWAPGGQRLAYTQFSISRHRLVTSIVVVHDDGSHKRVIAGARLGSTQGFTFITEPAWSPDGTQIAYTKTTLDPHTYYFHNSLHLVHPDGTGKQLLKRDAGSAAWSPDGDRIAFASIRDENGTDCGSDECSYRSELYVMRADGTHLVRLTRNKGDDYSPDWSADGQRLVFASDRNFPSGSDGAELYSIEPDGSCLTWLTNGSPSSFAPDLQPDPLADTAPAGCGAVPRRPLVEARGRRAGRVKHFKPLWLGKRYRSMILSDVSARPRFGADLAYDDCGRFDPRDCGPSVYLSERWACSGGLLGFPNLRVRNRRGALVTFSQRRGWLTVNSGAAQIDIDLAGPHRRGRHQAMGVVDELRRLSQSSPAARLARAKLPRRLLRQLRRIESAHERLGSIKAVRKELGFTGVRVRNGLRLARALRRHGRVKAIGCPSRPDRFTGVPIPFPQPNPKVAPALRKIPGVEERISRNGR